MGEMRVHIEKKIMQARKAKEEWDFLIKKTDLKENEYVILFPSNSDECSYFGMLYLDTFLQRVYGKAAVILTDDEYVKNNVEKFSQNIKYIIYYDQDQIRNLISLYELFNFDHRLIVISLDEPYCRKATGIIGVNGTTVEQLVAIGIYAIIPFQPISSKDNMS